MIKENLQNYSDQELSLRVFNDEYLYSIRGNFYGELMPALIKRFITNEQQLLTLKNDLYEDHLEITGKRATWLMRA